jgi:hypothetical protein
VDVLTSVSSPIDKACDIDIYPQLPWSSNHHTQDESSEEDWGSTISEKIAEHF